MKIKRDKADILWSKLVRARDKKCRKCGRRSPYKLEAHHLMPRSRSSTRYLLENGITLCFRHHAIGDESIHRRGREMAIELIGKKEFNRLEKLSSKFKAREKARKEFMEKLSLDRGQAQKIQGRRLNKKLLTLTLLKKKFKIGK